MSFSKGKFSRYSVTSRAGARAAMRAPIMDPADVPANAWIRFDFKSPNVSSAAAAPP